MADYLALIANCLIMGEHYSIVGEQKYLNLIKLSLDKLDIEIEELPDLLTHNLDDFKGKAKYTTNLFIKNISSTQFKNAELIASEIAEVLSLATCSPVRKFGYDFQGEGSMKPFMGQLQYFRPLIDTHRGDLVRGFLEKTWPAYHRLKNPRNLNIALQYFVLSQMSGQPMELLLVVSFVLLENLKHSFALQQGYPYIGGYFRPHGATASKLGKAKGFKELLEQMFKQVGMTPALQSIIDLRNEIIHSGISSLSRSAQTTIYDNCQDIVREYLLRLLGYTGQYYPYSTPNAPATI